MKTELKNILERHEGRERAIKAQELACLLDTDERHVRQVIEELIDDGLPVVSATESPAGYFIPVSLEQAKEYTQSLRSRAVLIFLRRKKVIRNTALHLKPASQGRLI